MSNYILFTGKDEDDAGWECFKSTSSDIDTLLKLVDPVKEFESNPSYAYILNYWYQIVDVDLSEIIREGYTRDLCNHPLKHRYKVEPKEDREDREPDPWIGSGEFYYQAPGTYCRVCHRLIISKTSTKE